MNQRNRLIINVASNYTALTIYGVANFFLVGYSVKKIGAESFGLLSLAISLSTAADILIAGICQALTKHLAEELGRKNVENINKLFNTSLGWFLLCGLLACAALLMLAFYLDRFFEIPSDLVVTGRWVMMLMAFKTLLIFPFTTFQGILWGMQRYDLTNVAKIVGVLIRAGGVVVYFEVLHPGIIEFVVITIFGFMLERLIWFFFAIRLLPRVRWGFQYLSMAVLKMLLGFGGLLLIIYVANLLGYEAVKWVIGSELSIEDVGGYTVIATLASFAGTLVRAIANVLMPATSYLNAAGRQTDIKRLASISTKYAMTVATILCIVPIPFLRPFLKIWLGNGYSPVYLNTLALCGAILLVGQWFVTMPLCLVQMMAGMGRIKIQAAVTMSWAMLGLILMWVILRWISPLLLVAVLIISLARVVGGVALLYYGMTTLAINSLNFLVKSIGLPALAGAATLFFLWAIAFNIDFSDCWSLISAMIYGSLLFALLMWLLIFETNERTFVVNVVKKLL